MKPWWQTGVIYQIYPRSFMDANNDGLGDLEGVRQRLPYLASLGIDAIWFSPIFPSPMADFGYDVADYTDIHPDYGTLATFDALLEEAHQHSLKVLLDLVPNHTSSAHPWFEEARQSRDNPKRDWYIWQDPKADATPPNNWLSYFGGPAWTYDELTGQYYMHNFDPEQPELNWRNSQVKAAIFDSIRFWLKRGVDGFRMDVIDRLLKDPDFRDNPPNPAWSPGDAIMWSQDRIHSEGAPGTHALMREFRDVFNEFPQTVAVGELSYALEAEEFAAFYGQRMDDNNGDELHLPFNFGLLGRAWRADVIRPYVDQYDASVPSYGWPNYVLGNHDVGRIASRYGQAQARVAALMLLTLRGTPTLYYGDEIGMTNATISEDKIQDPQGRNKAGFNRDECRTPMQWDASTNAGFNAGAEPWLPVAPDYPVVNVAAQEVDPSSTLNFYKRLLDYRHNSPELQSGDYAALDAGVPADCYVYQRKYEGKTCLIALNMTHDERTLSLTGHGIITVSTDHQRDGHPVDLTQFSLLPDEGVIIELQ
jgi:alpha-glucosidase